MHRRFREEQFSLRCLKPRLVWLYAHEPHDHFFHSYVGHRCVVCSSRILKVVKTSRLLTLAALLVLITGCANPHFFPRLRPLFPGFAEEGLSSSARSALAEAKIDFQLARQGNAPRYAKYVGEESTSRSKIYQGRGYRLTRVMRTDPTAEGPDIVLQSSITGGKPWHYDEVDEVSF